MGRLHDQSRHHTYSINPTLQRGTPQGMGVTSGQIGEPGGCPCRESLLPQTQLWSGTHLSVCSDETAAVNIRPINSEIIRQESAKGTQTNVKTHRKRLSALPSGGGVIYCSWIRRVDKTKRPSCHKFRWKNIYCHRFFFGNMAPKFGLEPGFSYAWHSAFVVTHRRVCVAVKESPWRRLAAQTQAVWGHMRQI